MHVGLPPCDGPATTVPVSKNTFSGEIVKAKILKICDVRAKHYPFREDLAKQMHPVEEVSIWKYAICRRSMLKFFLVA